MEVRFLLRAPVLISPNMLPEKLQKQILLAQRNEITEHHIYLKLAASVKHAENAKILEKIAIDELSHHGFWKSQTKQTVEPSRYKIWKYSMIAKVFGLTFGIKLMEKGEEQAQINYDQIAQHIPEAKQISEDEDRHEKALIAMIDEERLKYVGSIVLGLNDALTELTGALAGLTLVLQNTRLIAITGLITGIAASFSMAASEYLSTKSENSAQSPIKASIYTGIAYVLTVLFLIFPYFIFQNVFFCLGFALVNALIVIFIFTFYISIAKDLPFRKRFLEMAGISMGVAAITFGIGYLIRIFIGIEI